MQIRDRIIAFRRVPASQLKPSPRNWRTHPAAQRDALRGVLAEVGVADAVLARQLPDGSLELIDGHCRAELMPDQEMPVLVLDVDDREAATLLASLDPLAAMAETDRERLDSLLAGLDPSSPALRSLFDDLAGKGSAADAGEPELRDVWQVLVDCRDEAEQLKVLGLCEENGLKCRALVG